jgi:hypothetical protein
LILFRNVGVSGRETAGSCRVDKAAFEGLLKRANIDTKFIQASGT